MARLTELDYTFAVILNAAFHTSPKESRAAKSPTVKEENTQKAQPRNPLKGNRNVRGPKPVDHDNFGTGGLPKALKGYGNGAPVGVTNCSKGVQPYGSVAGPTFHSINKKPKTECSRITELRRRNQEDPSMVNFRLIKLISNLEVLTLAYELIKSKPGNMTKGTTPETLD